MDRREKRYVPVTVRFDTDGKMRPLLIEFDEGQTYKIDKILDVRRAACQSVGSVGDRYTCRIQGQETYLWLEKGKWFVIPKKELFRPNEKLSCNSCIRQSWVGIILPSIQFQIFGHAIFLWQL